MAPYNPPQGGFAPLTPNMVESDMEGCLEGVSQLAKDKYQYQEAREVLQQGYSSFLGGPVGVMLLGVAGHQLRSSPPELKCTCEV